MIYTYCHTLSLHDALPIYQDIPVGWRQPRAAPNPCRLSRQGPLTGRECVCAACLWPRCDYCPRQAPRSEEHTSELQSLMRISYAVFCWKNKTITNQANKTSDHQ